MRKAALTVFTFILLAPVLAQKKPLDHSVYDSWQSLGERTISSDGRWIAYSINAQEGDNLLVVRSADSSYYKEIPRGYGAIITNDNQYLVCKIRAPFADTREARIKKKRPDDMPKDSLAIVWLGKDSVWKKERVKGFRMPEESFGWVAYHLEKKIVKPERPAKATDPKQVTDSLQRIIDSLQLLVENPPSNKKKSKKDDAEFNITDAEGDETPAGAADAGSDLMLHKLNSTQQYHFERIIDYQFDKKGTKLLLQQARDTRDSSSKQAVLIFDLRKLFADTIASGGNDFKQFAFSEDGTQLAFVAERDAQHKALQKFYKLWYFKEGQDSAVVVADKTSEGMHVGFTISENGSLSFSKSGKRLFLGTAPIQPPKDTTLVEMDLVKLDIWHYNDDYLQTQQLSRLQRDLRENFLAVYDLQNKTFVQLASKELPTIALTRDGDGDTAYAITDYGKRVESQWAGNTKKDIYSVNLKDGSRKLIKKDLWGLALPNWMSPSGRYFVWYDYTTKKFFAWDGTQAKNITAGISVALHNEEHDSPSDPSPYGIAGWSEAEDALYIYDRYDLWKVDPKGIAAPKNVTENGRKNKTSYRYQRVDREETAFKSGQLMHFRKFDERTKQYSYVFASLDSLMSMRQLVSGPYNIGALSRAKEAPVYLYTKERFEQSPDLYVARLQDRAERGHRGYGDQGRESRLTYTNPQQAAYNWGTAELFQWKTFNGKTSEGILYKPEDFDPTKKYPMIVYFYERLSNGLYDYQAPAPTPSRLNITFFVSRGYLVFAPDIRYTTGHPAKSAYDYIVSGTKALISKYKWVDAANIGIQGQSWGGIQVAQLITMTDMYKAAWAGAPVANMTSAYGGIRWESGANRQFQYEKTQSRIGATLWEKPELYIESSPLFHLPKVKTPLVIMHNDADGAVPWYQGIELFTGMRRLGKKVWMLNYNGEAHNLVQRKNRKDIQIRQQQFFDWLLKGAKPSRWITDGVPAVKKGKDWGLDIE